MKKLALLLSAVLCLNIAPVSGYSSDADDSVVSYISNDLHNIIRIPKVTDGFDVNEKGTAAISETDGMLSMTFNGSDERLETIVEINTEDVSDKRMKYISFDLCAEALMDFVVTIGDGDASLSLYTDDFGAMAVSSQNYRDVYKSGGSWEEHIPDEYLNLGDGVEYEREKNYNVCMICDSKDGSVSVFIDSRKIGKTRTGTGLSAWRSNYVRFIHYTTHKSNDTIHLKNLQIGYCEEYGLYKCGVLSASQSCEFPSGDSVWISLELNALNELEISDNREGITLDINNTWGALYKSGDTRYTDYAEAYAAGDVHCFECTSGESLNLTVGLDRIERKIFAYTNTGAYVEHRYGLKEELPNVLNVTGNTAENADFGNFTDAPGVCLYDSKGCVIEGFGETDDALSISVFGVCNAETAVAIYGFYNADDTLLAVDCYSACTTSDGVYVITKEQNFGIDKVPTGTEYMRIFAVDSLGTLRPLNGSVRYSDRSEEYTKCRFDSKEYLFRIIEGENENACISTAALAEMTDGEYYGSTVRWGNTEITFKEGDRLAEFNDGHLILESRPFKDKGALFVPVSVLEPTMRWAVYYDRFNSYLEVRSGGDYPNAEPVVYNISDYGAVGDGETDDGPAITAAINAAKWSGVPSKVVFEDERTYLIGERSDCMSYFDIAGVSNLTIDGRGSTVLLEKCTNTFLRFEDCANVKVLNLNVDYKELPFTQGKIKEVKKRTSSDSEEYFILEIEEGYPLPPSDKWVKSLYADGDIRGGWWFGSLMDPKYDRIKFHKYQSYWIDSVTHVEDRKYRVDLGKASYWWTTFMDVGDRFVINTRFSAYDISDLTHEGSTSMIEVTKSGDITFERCNIYATPWMGVSVGLNWGRINFINFDETLKKGRLLCLNSDGIHCWRNKEGITVENCMFMNSLDDQINTKGEDAIILSGSENEFTVDYELNFRIGDKLIFYDKGDGTSATDKTILGVAYLRSFKKGSNGITLTLDRNVPKATVGNLVYNSDSSTSGSVISKNKFMNSRRHAYITRSENSLFEDNVVEDCAGSMVSGSNELISSSSEGPFPSFFTMRRNKMTAPRTSNCYPIEFMSWNSNLTSSRAINGLLIEDNEINVPCCDYKTQKVVSAIRIDAVEELYMLNNKITSTTENSEGYTICPVYITNSSIEEIDGLDCNFTQRASNGAIITLNGCDFYETDIKNVSDLSGFSQKTYMAVD